MHLKYLTKISWYFKWSGLSSFS
ncbi:hypothetical protein FD724_33965 (plasmid) [Nostoc sp. C057]|nr:hypothetical protein FD724_33965 [Nostoc sp. C057]